MIDNSATVATKMMANVVEATRAVGAKIIKHCLGSKGIGVSSWRMFREYCGSFDPRATPGIGYQDLSCRLLCLWSLSTPGPVSAEAGDDRKPSSGDVGLPESRASIIDG